MSIVTPTYFTVLGGDADVAGAAEINLGKAIGGGTTDETTICLDNASWLYLAHGRRILSETTYDGQDTPQAPIATETGASYVLVLDQAVDLGENREDVTVSLDIGYTGTGSGDVRVRLYRRDTDVLLDTATGTTTAAQEQIDLALTGGVVSGCYITVEIKITTDGTVTLWGSRNTEDVTVDPSSDGALWRQVDQDAANGLQPGDSALYQRIEKNLRAAHNQRLRSCGTAWPVADAPTLACHQQMVIPLAVHEVTAAVTQLTLPIRHLVTEADVHLELIVVSSRDIRKGGETTVSVTGAVVSDELTADVTGLGGQVVLVCLGYRSSDGTATGTTANMTGDRFDVLRVDLTSGHGVTFTGGDRWRMELADPSAGSAQIDEASPMGYRTVMMEPVAAHSTDVLWAWPALPNGYHIVEQTGGNFRLSFTELGRTELYSWCLTESAVDALQSGKSSLRSGDRAAAPSIGRLCYARGRELYRRRSRVYHMGGSPDPLQADTLNTRQVEYHGVSRQLSPSGWETIGSAMVGNLDHEQSRLVSTDRVRDTYTVYALVGLSWASRVAEVDVDFRLTLSSFSGGAWSGTVVTSSTKVERLVTRGARFASGDDALLAFQVREAEYLSYHHLRGSYPLDEINRGRSGLAVVELSITDTETTTDHRLLRLQAQSSDGTTVDGRAINPSNPASDVLIHVPTWTALGSTGW